MSAGWKINLFTKTDRACCPSSIRKAPVGKSTCGFTLIELVVVIAIMGIAMAMFMSRSRTSLTWQQESMMRKLMETITFLHNQAIADQAFYRLEFNFESNSYKVGVMKAEAAEDESIKELAQDAGNLTLELAAFLNPSLGSEQSMIPPPDYPSMAEPVELLNGTRVKDVHTMRGVLSADQGNDIAYILFSPRGFSEFAVIHLDLLGGAQATILVNSFTGLTQLYRGYKEFQFTYGFADASES